MCEQRGRRWEKGQRRLLVVTVGVREQRTPPSLVIQGRERLKLTGEGGGEGLELAFDDRSVLLEEGHERELGERGWACEKGGGRRQAVHERVDVLVGSQGVGHDGGGEQGGFEGRIFNVGEEQVGV